MSGSYIKAHTDILEAPCKGNPILLSYKHYTQIVKNKVKKKNSKEHQRISFKPTGSRGYMSAKV